MVKTETSPTMRLNELTLQHYRNYETVSLDFPKTLNFLGENAQGKPTC